MQDKKKKKLNMNLFILSQANDILFTDDNHVTDHAPPPLINRHRNAFLSLEVAKIYKRKRKIV